MKLQHVLRGGIASGSVGYIMMTAASKTTPRHRIPAAVPMLDVVRDRKEAAFAAAVILIREAVS